VVTGPTNAVSLLIGGAVGVMSGVEPMQVAITLALMVGVFQLLAGVLRLGAIVDYISNPVVLGYITGAALLIALGQLPNVTGTPKTQGDVIHKFTFWIKGLSGAVPLSVLVALGTAGLILLLRKIRRSFPGAIVVLTVATACSYFFDFRSMGLKIVSDLSPVPGGLPPLTVPDLKLVGMLMPLAVATTVLSLVESSAIARAIATRTRQRLNLSLEFVGQGLANMTAAFTGGYPISGSPSRSSLNERSGASTRVAGILSGLLMVVVLLFMGPVLNYTPVAALAGLLLIVALDIIDLARIRSVFRSQPSDCLAFVVTLLGTWLLPLDRAIYLGVGLSIILFLRKARLLRIHEILVDQDNRLREIGPENPSEDCFDCNQIKIMHLEGRLFFGVAGELQTALDEALIAPDVKVVLLRLKRTQGMDVTIAGLLAEASEQLAAQGRKMLLAGVRKDAMRILQRTGAIRRIGAENVFPSQDKWFASVGCAVKRARQLANTQHECANCPLDLYLQAWNLQTGEELDPEKAHVQES
jgi:SulP family sulfate permease